MLWQLGDPCGHWPFSLSAYRRHKSLVSLPENLPGYIEGKGISLAIPELIRPPESLPGRHQGTFWKCCKDACGLRSAESYSPSRSWDLPWRVHGQNLATDKKRWQLRFPKSWTFRTFSASILLLKVSISRSLHAPASMQPIMFAKHISVSKPWEMPSPRWGL